MIEILSCIFYFICLLVIVAVLSYFFFDMRKTNRSFKRRMQLLEMIYEKVCILEEKYK